MEAIPLRGGWAELAEGRWASAKDAFMTALELEETAEALEGLSWAVWWLDDADTVFDARERAFRLYHARGDHAGAGRMATWLAADHLDFRGALSVASGWLRRAGRLLAPLEPGPDHGWLAFHEGYVAMIQGDTSRATELATRAAELGRSHDVTDLVMLGLALRGGALVECAEVKEGMACLDEATATALAGEATLPISRAWSCCFLVSACESVRDFRRAFEWCDRIAEFAERYGSRYMLGFCRAHYGAIHVWRGRWAEAEAEYETAIEAYSRSRPAFVAGALAGLAELRRRQGRWGDAQLLLDQAGPTSAPLCRASLALDQGDDRQAVDLAERALRQIPAHRRLARAPALELLVRARAKRGETGPAAEALTELREVARIVGTPPLQAAADLADGILAAAGDEHERARRLLEDAVDRFERTGAPFEAAQARLELAASLAALGSRAGAEREANACLDGFSRLGAEAEVRRARMLLSPPFGARAPLPDLTRREREVLRRITEGLTNRQIAERLVISEHTVHRHTTNILRKLNLPSRAAAAAHAVASGLLAHPEM
jgi:DNA-binding NarL/FixJ family response regulator